MAFRIVGVKTNYSTKEVVFGFFFKGGAHAPVAPPPPGYGLAHNFDDMQNVACTRIVISHVDINK